MKRLIHFITIFVFFLHACASTPDNYSELEIHNIDAGGARSVIVEVDHGEVKLLRSEDLQIHIEGQVLYPDALEYGVTATPGQVFINAFTHRPRSAKTPLLLIVRVPVDFQVKIKTETANIIGQGFTGDVEVDSTAGDITLQGLSGRMILNSNRGNITVRESSGIMSIVGNYGALTAQHVRGETAMSTIMGNITFDGSIAGGDSVRLEADHGSVFVYLGEDSTLKLQVKTTSGDVACMLPDIESTTRTCEGQLQSGDGSLAIRTVSGAVILQSIP